MRNKILALLNIRSSEAWLVSNLFWLQFFQGVGVAIFNTVAFTFFLTKFEITELPKVYLFSAVLLWITGWVYSKVEHAVEIKKLVPGIIIFVAFSILAIRLNFFATEGAWFFFLIFSWYYVIYLLTNLEFWGLAALLFDNLDRPLSRSYLLAQKLPAERLFLAAPRAGTQPEKWSPQAQLTLAQVAADAATDIAGPRRTMERANANLIEVGAKLQTLIGQGLRPVIQLQIAHGTLRLQTVQQSNQVIRQRRQRLDHRHQRGQVQAIGAQLPLRLMLGIFGLILEPQVRVAPARFAQGGSQ